MSIQQNSNQLTLFAVDFPVSPSVLQDDEKAPQTTDGSGPNTSVSFAALSPDGSWLKTSRDSYQWTLDGSLQEYSETWPKAGMIRYQLRASVAGSILGCDRRFPPNTPCRMDDGLSAGLDKERVSRIKGLGNAVVPQVAEWIGRRILEVDNALENA